MSAIVTIQGIELSEFLSKVEEASYNGQKRAYDELSELQKGIDWNKYGQLMRIKDIAELFKRRPDTIRRWIRYDNKFGEYVDTGRPMVATHKVREVYETEFLKSNKR